MNLPAGKPGGKPEEPTGRLPATGELPAPDRLPATGQLPATGRGVLVSGASRGLGRAVCHAFAAQGDRVAVHYGSRSDDARRTLESLPGTGHVLIGGDLSDPAEVARVADEAAEGLGGIDVLVNNAAVNAAHPLPTTGYEEWTAAWQHHLSVNLMATALLSHRAAHGMITRAVFGRIVNIGSRGAFRGEPDHPAYGATKAAVHALGQSLAVSLAPYGIGVASVAPGFFETERVASRLSGEEGEKIRTQSPFGRVASADEVAEAVRWLASPGAEWSSGAVLDLNGASYLR
ncbi:SDR family NAD(P)-dependent oxidoreductase [Streptomyces sp. NPDC050509]|uniref:SDR family NAD(P)-dependent oxidoreductase n=1 Tax=Streptomyces sp. NPDC050509 TaxID=3365620 RepID=UPI0037981103